MQTTKRHYKTLRGLIDALGVDQIDLRTFNRGGDYSPKFRKYLKFSVSDEVAAIRQIYKANPNFRNAVLNQINRTQGRAYFLN